MTKAPPTGITSYPPLFGVNRELNCPPLERIDLVAGDGAALCLHHTGGGKRGPVLMSPGTAMTALTYGLDTVPVNMIEYMVAAGFDLWLFDWRTSPLLPAHEKPYTLDDVAKYDWPAAVAEVRRRTGADQVSIMAHCLSSPCLLLSLLRGYLDPGCVRAFVASQVALHLEMTTVGKIKLMTRVDKLLPGREMMHQRHAKVTYQLADLAVSFLSCIIPKSYRCRNDACHRHSATFGDLILHSQVNEPTHNLMGDLIPECLTAFLKDVAIWARRDSILTDQDVRHLDRLKIPITFLSGSENHMFVPRSTERTYQLLCEKNGASYYQRKVYPNFGHLDCFIGLGAPETIWPDIAAALDPNGVGTKEEESP